MNMSADKHKKRDRAFAFIRSLGTQQAGWKINRHEERWGPRQRTFSGPMTDLMRYCVDRGLAKIVRQGRGGRANRNVFDAE